MQNNTNSAEAQMELEPNVQAQPLAPAGDNLTPSGEIQESAKNLPAPGAGDGCAAATCSAPVLGLKVTKEGIIRKVNNLFDKIESGYYSNLDTKNSDAG